MVTLALVAALQVFLPAQDARRAALLAAEDARARTPEQLQVLLGGVTDPDTLLQRVAVRGLGRLERPDLLPAMAPALAARAASVRMEAANAVAQAAYREGTARAWELLRDRLPIERDAAVRGALLAAAGHLAHEVDGVVALEPVLVSGLAAPQAAVREGAARGLYDLWRRQNRGRATSDERVTAVREAVRAEQVPFVRRVAFQALVTTGRLDSVTALVAARDGDPQFRLLAAQAARTQRTLPGRVAVAARALQDSAALVRIEGVRAVASPGILEQLGCGPLIAALDDVSVQVQLLAIDALGQGCSQATPPTGVLDELARGELTDTSWHRPARALLALAGADTVRAAIRLGRFAASPVWWARAAAARVAGRLRDTAALGRLLEDPVDNVREAALGSLAAVDSAAAARAALAQLSRNDFQLVLTAARVLLGGGNGANAATAAVAAFGRLTATGAETSRDTRLALLDLIEATAGPAEVEALRPALADFDPEVAARVAAILTVPSGREVRPTPRSPAAASLPTPGELRAMTRATIVMADGGRIDLVLHPDLAPTNVARFVGMARAGWFNGLTFHRVVPNFVVQGGSPGANEYVGASAFSRDEVGGSHRRGTVGISTRGRDTGDGQIFINLVDNLRLDHEYTVIGEVTAGWEALDAMLEGARIARIEVAPGPR